MVITHTIKRRPVITKKTAGAAFADWAPLDEDNIFEILLENYIAICFLEF